MGCGGLDRVVECGDWEPEETYIIPNPAPVYTTVRPSSSANSQAGSDHTNINMEPVSAGGLENDQIGHNRTNDQYLSNLFTQPAIKHFCKLCLRGRFSCRSLRHQSRNSKYISILMLVVCIHFVFCRRLSLMLSVTRIIRP